MATLTFFDAFKQRLGDGEIDLTTSTGHVFKLYLTNTAPNVDTHDDKADHTEISATGGYAAKTITHAWAETSAGIGHLALLGRGGPGVDGDRRHVRHLPLRCFVRRHARERCARRVLGQRLDGELTDTNTFTLNLDANFEIFTLDG